MPPPRRTAEPTWHRASPAPLVLVSGPEALLADRAVERIHQAMGAGVAVTNLDAGAYSTGALIAAASPSLFDEPGLVVVRGAGAMNDEFLKDALAYVERPDPEVVVVICHNGAVRGKKLIDTLRKAKVPEYTSPAVKKDADLVDFVRGEFEREQRPIQAAVARQLFEAVGADIAELAAASQQLMNDVEGTVTEDAVTRYYGSRLNATAFTVADAAIVGDVTRAVALTRHALTTGVDPVPLNAALASKLRTLAKVGASRGRRLDPTRDLGVPPWQVDRARRDLRHWTADSLGQAIEIVAAADADIKGGSRAPHFALERAVREVAQLASS